VQATTKGGKGFCGKRSRWREAVRRPQCHARNARAKPRVRDNITITLRQLANDARCTATNQIKQVFVTIDFNMTEI
jgi:hypothetical protein